MGICQTVCGAATSGKGFTGAQIASAIRAASNAQRKRHQERVEQEREAQSSQHKRTRSTLVQSLETVEDKCFNETAVSKTTRRNADGRDEEITVTELAPEVFRFLRQLEGVQEQIFCDEWDLDSEKSELELGEGRSMAMFLKSKSMEFMCKTIAEVEANVLLSILKSLTRHLARNKDSLLMRFLMILKVEVQDEVGYILCFGDVFSPCDALHERWDVKGRKPKPGKYLHFPKFISEIDEHGHETKHNAKGSLAPSESVVVDHLDQKKLITRKDKDLNRLFWMDPNVREALVTALVHDFEFLLSNGMMDYSLLIGVKYNEEEPEAELASIEVTVPAGESATSPAGVCSGSPTRPHSSSDHMKMKFVLGEENLKGLVEKRGQKPSRESSPDAKPVSPLKPPLGPTTSRQLHVANSMFHDGITSIGCHETYYIGVIDMLTVYNGKKKSANFFKKFLWKAETLSTIPPEMYRDRIKEYCKKIFPEVKMPLKQQ